MPINTLPAVSLSRSLHSVSTVGRSAFLASSVQPDQFVRQTHAVRFGSTPNTPPEVTVFPTTEQRLGMLAISAVANYPTVKAMWDDYTTELVETAKNLRVLYYGHETCPAFTPQAVQAWVQAHTKPATLADSTQVQQFSATVAEFKRDFPGMRAKDLLRSVQAIGLVTGFMHPDNRLSKLHESNLAASTSLKFTLLPEYKHPKRVVYKQLDELYNQILFPQWDATYPVYYQASPLNIRQGTLGNSAVLAPLVALLKHPVQGPALIQKLQLEPPLGVRTFLSGIVKSPVAVDIATPAARVTQGITHAKHLAEAILAHPVGTPNPELEWSLRASVAPLGVRMLEAAGNDAELAMINKELALYDTGLGQFLLPTFLHAGQKRTQGKRRTQLSEQLVNSPSARKALEKLYGQILGLLPDLTQGIVTTHDVEDQFLSGQDGPRTAAVLGDLKRLLTAETLADKSVMVVATTFGKMERGCGHPYEHYQHYVADYPKTGLDPNRTYVADHFDPVNNHITWTTVDHSGSKSVKLSYEDSAKLFGHMMFIKPNVPPAGIS